MLWVISKACMLGAFSLNGAKSFNNVWHTVEKVPFDAVWGMVPVAIL